MLQTPELRQILCPQQSGLETSKQFFSYLVDMVGCHFGCSVNFWVTLKTLDLLQVIIFRVCIATGKF